MAPNIVNMKLHLLVLIAAIAIVFTSCEKSPEAELTPEAFELDISGEGGDSTIVLGPGNWRISKVINSDANVRLFGNSYAPDGEMVLENRPLELNGLGSLVIANASHGLRIVHETPGTVRLALDENRTERPFNFSVVLENGTETREIFVKQPESGGYSFDHIEYFLAEGDGDSVYMRNQLFTYNFDLIEPQRTELPAFNGPNVVVNSRFESDDDYAFFWLTDKPVEVSVPADISNGNISLSAEKRTYGEIFNEPYENSVSVTADVPAGKTSFSTYIEERRRTVSYRLTIVNNRTGMPREVVGKWLEVSPTGRFEVKVTD